MKEGATLSRERTTGNESRKYFLLNRMARLQTTYPKNRSRTITLLFQRVSRTYNYIRIHGRNIQINT